MDNNDHIEIIINNGTAWGRILSTYSVDTEGRLVAQLTSSVVFSAHLIYIKGQPDFLKNKLPSVTKVEDIPAHVFELPIALPEFAIVEKVRYKRFCVREGNYQFLIGRSKITNLREIQGSFGDKPGRFNLVSKERWHSYGIDYTVNLRDMVKDRELVLSCSDSLETTNQCFDRMKNAMVFK